jgi:hypothetical protein
MGKAESETCLENSLSSRLSEHQKSNLKLDFSNDYPGLGYLQGTVDLDDSDWISLDWLNQKSRVLAAFLDERTNPQNYRISSSFIQKRLLKENAISLLTHDDCRVTDSQIQRFCTDYHNDLAVEAVRNLKKQSALTDSFTVFSSIGEELIAFYGQQGWIKQAEDIQTIERFTDNGNFIYGFKMSKPTGISQEEFVQQNQANLSRRYFSMGDNNGIRKGLNYYEMLDQDRLFKNNPLFKQVSTTLRAMCEDENLPIYFSSPFGQAKALYRAAAFNNAVIASRGNFADAEKLVMNFFSEQNLPANFYLTALKEINELDFQRRNKNQIPKQNRKTKLSYDSVDLKIESVHGFRQRRKQLKAANKDQPETAVS